MVAGFEPADILDALCRMARQYREGSFKVENAYPRAVSDGGNPRARAVLAQVFRTSDALWRGLGAIPQSGLALNPAYERFDALTRLGLELPESRPLPGCRCGGGAQGASSHPTSAPSSAKPARPPIPWAPAWSPRKGAARPTSSTGCSRRDSNKEGTAIH